MTVKEKKLRAQRRNMERQAANAAITNGAEIPHEVRDQYNESQNLRKSIIEMLQNGSFNTVEEEIQWMKETNIPGSILDGVFYFKHMVPEYKYKAYGIANIPCMVRMVYTFQFSSIGDLQVDIQSPRTYSVSYSDDKKKKAWETEAMARWIMNKNSLQGCQIGIAYRDDMDKDLDMLYGYKVSVGKTEIVLYCSLREGDENKARITRLGGMKVLSTIYSTQMCFTQGVKVKSGRKDKSIYLRDIINTDAYDEYMACKEVYRKFKEMCLIDNQSQNSSPQYDEKMARFIIQKMIEESV